MECCWRFGAIAAFLTPVSLLEIISQELPGPAPIPFDFPMELLSRLTRRFCLVLLHSRVGSKTFSNGGQMFQGLP